MKLWQDDVVFVASLLAFCALMVMADVRQAERETAQLLSNYRADAKSITTMRESVQIVTNKVAVGKKSETVVTTNKTVTTRAFPVMFDILQKSQLKRASDSARKEASSGRK